MTQTAKKILIDRKNPIVRLPQKLFKDIDKRKRKIPVTIDTGYENTTIIKIDWEELEK